MGSHVLVGDARWIRQRRNDDAGIANAVLFAAIGEQVGHTPTRKALDAPYQAVHLGGVGLCGPEAGVIWLPSVRHVGIGELDDTAVEDSRCPRGIRDQYGSRPA
jgi:hypothetical protein